MLRKWLQKIFGARLAAHALTHEQVVSESAVSRVESFATKMERAAAVRMLGQRVQYSTFVQQHVSNGDLYISSGHAVLAWVGRAGEPITVSSGTWAQGFAGLYIDSPADRLPTNGKTGYLVYDQTRKRWFAPTSIRPA